MENLTVERGGRVLFRELSARVEAGEADVTLEAWSEAANGGLEVERQDQGLAVWRTRRSGKGLAMAVAADARFTQQLTVRGFLGKATNAHE